MKGKGARHERETVITFNEADEIASIWTASETIYRRLKRLGYTPTEDNDRSAAFEIPKKHIRLPRPQRRLSEAQLAARKGRFRPGTQSGEAIGADNSPDEGSGAPEV
jgi:hypothetical protein